MMTLYDIHADVCVDVLAGLLASAALRRRAARGATAPGSREDRADREQLSFAVRIAALKAAQP